MSLFYAVLNIDFAAIIVKNDKCSQNSCFLLILNI